MIRAALLALSLISAPALAAQDYPTDTVTHVVHLAGLSGKEGRYIRVDMVDENQFKSGYYFCAGPSDVIYGATYTAKSDGSPVHSEHALKFSICQNETLTECQEFATDQYTTYRNQDGQLENDVSELTVDISALKDNFTNCQSNYPAEMDNLVRQSIHANDRRFSRIG